jgi:hypothetical protein
MHRIEPSAIKRLGFFMPICALGFALNLGGFPAGQGAFSISRVAVSLIGGWSLGFLLVIGIQYRLFFCRAKVLLCPLWYVRNDGTTVSLSSRIA